MLTNIRNCNITPSYGSDHYLVVLEIVFNPFVVGEIKGYINSTALCYMVRNTFAI